MALTEPNACERSDSVQVRTRTSERVRRPGSVVVAQPDLEGELSTDTLPVRMYAQHNGPYEGHERKEGCE